MPQRVPKRRYFNFAFPCRYRSRAPKIDGSLRDWQKRFLVPDLMTIEEREAYADISMAWNENGIYFAINLKGKVNPLTVNPAEPPKADCFEVWLDMRDARNMHHAGRYCHHFQFLPIGGGRDANEATGQQIAIARAPERSNICDPDILEVAAKTTRQGYAMEVAIPAEALTGFDPEENPRLGFTYLLNDTHLGTQWWSVSTHFRFRSNPSMWGTAVLSRE